ncbi:hypothetical protein POM88_013585 [Heracleum sosnowskyi]|uniref:Protein FAR1-RELATED SEQUENCE n=1 Tax=Heracleum sosnowskyi TaxID=360622 RepID=A0AAD8J0A9_9APIA|nr:hypothetical protein POM88_013585 [Heracleum sosnowskyi]
MGRNPVVIVTDQCPAMKQAIPISCAATNEFPAMRHRLFCIIVHVYLYVVLFLHLWNYLCKKTNFMEKMKKYIWSSTLELAEFEKGWKSVLKEFKLEGNRWLWEMFVSRTSWIPAFFRDKPMFGLIRTTSSSESENNFFSQFHRQSDSLCEFYLRFRSAMNKQIYEYARLNQEDLSAIPSTVSKLFIEVDVAHLVNAIDSSLAANTAAGRAKSRLKVDGGYLFLVIGPLVDGVKCYIMKDVLIWSRTVENRPSSLKFVVVSYDFRQMGTVSLTVNLGDGSGLTKKDNMKVMMGSQPMEDFTIHAPNQCKNKGSGLKRFVSQREKAIKEGNKRPRKYKLCSSSVHDYITFLGKNKSSIVDAEKNKSGTVDAKKNKSGTVNVTKDVEVDSTHED